MRGFIRFSVWVIAIGAAICFVLYLTVFDTWVVPMTDPRLTTAVMPTLFPNDRLLTSRHGTPSAGMLVRCTSPEPGSEYVIGRIMGAPGDTVIVDNGKVVINGKGMPSRHACPQVKLQHPITGEDVTLSCAAEETGAWTYHYLLHPERPEGQRSAVVENGKFFLLSDNRAIHHDSRDFGQIDATTCEHIVFRLWGDSFVDTERRFTLLY